MDIISCSCFCSKNNFKYSIFSVQVIKENF